MRSVRSGLVDLTAAVQCVVRCPAAIYLPWKITQSAAVTECAGHCVTPLISAIARRMPRCFARASGHWTWQNMFALPPNSGSPACRTPGSRRGRSRNSVCSGRAMEQHGLEGGCVVYAAREKIREPLWAVSGRDARETPGPSDRFSIEAARRVHARYLVVLSGALPNVPVMMQLAAMIENLRWAADIAGKAGMTPVSGIDQPQERSQHAVASHWGSLCSGEGGQPSGAQAGFDTSHIQIMDGDLLPISTRCGTRLRSCRSPTIPGDSNQAQASSISRTSCGQ